MTNNIKRIYLIRHGESTHNSNGNKLSGLTDVDLTKKGIEQCKTTRKYVEKLEIDKIYSSSLKRAINSANLIFPKKEVVFTKSLREFNYGNYEGINANFKTEDLIIKKWNTSPGNLTFPEGDNTLKFSQNFYNSILNMVEISNEHNIAFVTHKTAIRLFVAKIIHLDPDYFRLIPCSNCGVTELWFNKESNFILHSLNVIAYNMF